jgi:RimJ/RimL family protein N-acetyltransferase
MDAASHSFGLRDMRLEIDDLQKWSDLIEFDRAEGEPRVSPDAMLEKRKQAVEDHGKTCFGFAIESEAQTVGMVSFFDIGTLPKLGTPIFVVVMVNPKYRRRGLGRRLYASGLDRLRELGFDRCITNVREGNEAALAFADHLGCSELDRAYLLTMDLATLPDEGIAMKSDDTVQIFSLAELRDTDAQWREKLHDLCKAFEKDLPSRVEVSIFPEDLDEFEKRLLVEWKMDLGGSFVAVTDGVWAGTTWVSQPTAGDDWCFHIMTGVRPEFRRRGLVKTLKRAGFAWGKSAGIRYILTNQQESNLPMLALNRQLGFETKSCYITLEHQFG